MKSLKKRVQQLEQPYMPKSIFADWCIMRKPDWKGSDLDAFSEWVHFMQTATPEQMESQALNPDTGFNGSFQSNRL